MTKFSIFLFSFYFLAFSKLEYDPSKAFDFWHYETASYCAPSNISSWSIPNISIAYPNIQDIEVIQNPSTSILAFTGFDADKNLAFVAFRGTITTFVNWYNNLNAFQTAVNEYCDGCFVHSGFWVDYNAIKDQAKDAILRLRKKHANAEFAIIGHSMGAAVATFALLDLHDQVQPDYFYTFGMPRMGNKEFANFVDGRFPELLKVRITHYRDIIPRGPLTSMGYNHFNTEVFYTEDMSSFVICKEAEDTNCINQFSILNFSIEDHRTYFGLNMHEFKKSCN